MIPESILITIVIITFIILILLVKAYILIYKINKKIDQHCNTFTKDDIVELKDFMHNLNAMYYKLPKE